MIGKKVRIKKDTTETDVVIVDKIMTNMATYSKAAIMNNAPFEVYVGLLNPELDVECPLIEFKVIDIIKLY